MVGIGCICKQGVAAFQNCTVLYMYGTGKCISSIICVCSLWRKGLFTYQESEPMFKTYYIFPPFLQKNKTPAQCNYAAYRKNNRHEKVKAMLLVAAAAVAALA